jgi:hypothetical protein
MNEELEVRVDRLERLVRILLENQFPGGVENAPDIKKHFKGYLREDEGPMGNN